MRARAEETRIDAGSTSKCYHQGPDDDDRDQVEMSTWQNWQHLVKDWLSAEVDKWKLSRVTLRMLVPLIKIR